MGFMASDAQERTVHPQACFLSKKTKTAMRKHLSCDMRGGSVFNRRNTHRDLVGVRAAHALRTFLPVQVVALARLFIRIAGIYDALMDVMAMSMGW
jgi:hypothetical protein